MRVGTCIEMEQFNKELGMENDGNEELAKLQGQEPTASGGLVLRGSIWSWLTEVRSSFSS